VRANAFPAILPIASLTCASFVTATGAGRTLRAWTYLWLGAALALLLLAVSSLIDRTIATSPSTGMPGTSLQASLIHDLAGVSVYSGEVLFPSYILKTRPEITLERLGEHYRPEDLAQLISRRYWQEHHFYARDGEEFADLCRVWWRAVTQHPLAYLRHRAGVIETMFQLRGGVYYPFDTGIAANDLGLEFPHRPVYVSVISLLERVTGVFFRSWIFLIVALAIVFWGSRQRAWASVAVCISGVVYVLPYAVISSGSDFRYVWWLIVATLLGCMLLISDLTTSSRVLSARSSSEDRTL
jgi:hypothetical protein